MKDLKIKEKFIQLRAQGLSYSKISQELNTSKATLISWAKDLELEIQNAVQLEKDDLLEKYKMAKNHRLEKLFITYNKILNEIDKRSFSDVPTVKLLDLAQRFHKEIEYNSSPTEHKSVNAFSTLDLEDIETQLI